MANDSNLHSSRSSDSVCEGGERMNVEEIRADLRKAMSEHEAKTGKSGPATLSAKTIAALLDALEAKEREIDDLKAERAKTEDNFTQYAEEMSEQLDKAVKDIPHICAYCAKTRHFIGPCGNCVNGSGWQWRGAGKEQNDATH